MTDGVTINGIHYVNFQRSPQRQELEIVSLLMKDILPKWKSGRL